MYKEVEIFRIVVGEEEMSPKEFVEMLIDLGRRMYDKPKSKEIEVRCRVYELGEGCPPSTEVGRIVYDDNGGNWLFVSVN